MMMILKHIKLITLLEKYQIEWLSNKLYCFVNKIFFSKSNKVENLQKMIKTQDGIFQKNENM